MKRNDGTFLNQNLNGFLPLVGMVFITFRATYDCTKYLTELELAMKILRNRKLFL